MSPPRACTGPVPRAGQDCCLAFFLLATGKQSGAKGYAVAENVDSKHLGRKPVLK
jgi:hypothetical protein